MTFEIIRPTKMELARLTSPHQCYWSNAALLWFNKWGLAARETVAPEGGGFPIVLRGTEHAPLAGFFEGPLTPNVASELGIVVEDQIAPSIEVHIDDEPTIVGPGFSLGVGVIARPVDSQRRTPKTMGESSTPYVMDPGFDHPATQLNYQRLTPPPGWTTLVQGCDPANGTLHPIVVSNGHRLVSGVPILDLASQKMAMPDCNHGYFSSARGSIGWRIEAWLADALIAHAVTAGYTVLRMRPWPAQFRAALSVRHDYDRAISDRALAALLDFYDSLGIRCSFSFMARLLPTGQPASIVARGHEIALHTEASDLAAMKDELSALNSHLERGQITGVTCHGGTSSAGHMGDKLFRWCDELRLKYTEQLGRDLLFPNPAISASDGLPVRLGCMVMSTHQSLDLTTAPHGHFAAMLAQEIPFRLAVGGAVNIMNHPDIHIRELKALLSSFDLRTVWCATHEEITEWFRITHYDATWAQHSKTSIIAFPQPLSHSLTIDIITTKGIREFQVDERAQTAEIVSGQDRREMRDKIYALGHELEFVANQFRKRHSDCIGKQESNKLKRFKPAVFKRTWWREQPLRSALIVRSADDVTMALKQLNAMKELFRRPPQVARVFLTTGGRAGSPTSDHPACVFTNNITQLFDIVFLHESVKLFETPFGFSFYEHVMQFAARGGVVLFPDRDRFYPKSGVRSMQVGKILGGTPYKVPDSDYFAISGRFEHPLPRSTVLSWYLRRGSQVILDEVALRTGELSLSEITFDPLVAEFLEAGELADSVRGELSCSADLENTKQLVDGIVRSHAHQVSGISYKSTLVKHIVNQMLPDRKNLHFVDIGGGFGALAAEIAITSEPGLIATATTRDVAPQNLLVACSLYSAFQPELRDRYRFSLGSAENFALWPGNDVVCFIDSLLYIKKSRLIELLDRVWNTLSIGGLLIVCENIKGPSFERDHDIMFDAIELNELLERYGAIRFFPSNSCSEVSRLDVKNKTVFRVVQKTV